MEWMWGREGAFYPGEKGALGCEEHLGLDADRDVNALSFRHLEAPCDWCLLLLLLLLLLLWRGVVVIIALGEDGVMEGKEDVLFEPVLDEGGSIVPGPLVTGYLKIVTIGGDGITGFVV